MIVELTKEEIGLLMRHLWLNPCQSGCIGQYDNKYQDCNCPISKQKERLLIKLTMILEREKEKENNERLDRNE